MIRTPRAAFRTISLAHPGVRSYHTTKLLELNRIFVDRSEVCTNASDIQVISFQSSDDRFQHIENILKVQVGDTIKMGVVGSGITDAATLVAKTDDIVTIHLGKPSDLTPTPRPVVDLIMAFPRPARLTWLFPVISSLGVGRISLIRAAKTEKGYMASHYYIPGSQKLRQLLMLGLSQASVDCWLPSCDLHPSHDLALFLSGLDDMYPPDQCLRLLAHPLKPRPPPDESRAAVTNRRQLNNNLATSTLSQTSAEDDSGTMLSASFPASVPFHRLEPPASWTNHESSRPSGTSATHSFNNAPTTATATATAVRSNDVSRESGGGAGGVCSRRIVIAVGPEGGWSDAELLALQARGFRLVHMLGERVLRTDIAVPALLALANEWHSRHVVDRNNEIRISEQDY